MSVENPCAVLPHDLKDKIAELNSRLLSEPNLFNQFPITTYAALLTARLGYKQVPPLQRQWSIAVERQYGRSTVERYHQLLLLTLMQDCAPRLAQTYPDSVMAPLRKFFANIGRRIEEPLTGQFLYGVTGFDKDLGVCSGNLIPCGAQLVNPDAGISLRSIFRVGVAQWLPLVLFLRSRVGGRRPLYEMHMDIRQLLLEFNPNGWRACYRRMVDLMVTDARILGVCGASWWFDPRLASISPRLSFLRQMPVDQGARVFDLGEDATSTHDALANSPERKARFDRGEYRPRKHLLIWSRDDIMAWSAANPATA